MVRTLEIALILDWTHFPGFRDAFDAPDIRWDLDPVPFETHLLSIEKGGNMTCRQFALSYAKLYQIYRLDDTCGKREEYRRGWQGLFLLARIGVVHPCFMSRWIEMPPTCRIDFSSTKSDPVIRIL